MGMENYINAIIVLYCLMVVVPCAIRMSLVAYGLYKVFNRDKK